jgi:hypothetical protein
LTYANHTATYVLKDEPVELSARDYQCTYVGRSYINGERSYYVIREHIRGGDKIEILHESKDGKATGWYVIILRSELLAKLEQGKLKEIP